MRNTASKASGKSATASRALDAKYAALIRRFPLRPLRSESELDAAHDVLRPLMLRDAGNLTAGEEAYLDVLSMLVADYESKHHPFNSDASVPDVLRFLIRESGMSVTDLGQVVGSQPQASMLLSGARLPSKEQVVCLAEHFRVSPYLFLPRLGAPRKRSA